MPRLYVHSADLIVRLLQGGAPHDARHVWRLLLHRVLLRYFPVLTPAKAGTRRLIGRSWSLQRWRGSSLRLPRVSGQNSDIQAAGVFSGFVRSTASRTQHLTQASAGTDALGAAAVGAVACKAAAGILEACSAQPSRAGTHTCRGQTIVLFIANC